jgi:hypothetical protein
VDAESAVDEGRMKRTAKSCGPDAPTLASSSREPRLSRAMVANKPGHQGEREGNRKTIAQGMPVEPGEPVADYPVHFLHEPRVIKDTRHSLRPLLIEGHRSAANLGRSRAPGRERMSGCLKFESGVRKHRRKGAATRRHGSRRRCAPPHHEVSCVGDFPTVSASS